MAPYSEAAQQTLQTAEQVCLKRGARLTPLRRQVLSLLLAASGPVKAYDLLKQIGQNGDAKPPTVYRALDFLMETGLAHKVEALNAYVACSHAGVGHVAALYICNDCGRVDERIGHLDDADKGPEDFVVRRSVIEHYGSCGHCET